MVRLEGVCDDEDNNGLAFDAVDWSLCAGVTPSKLDPKYRTNYLIVHPDGYALNDQNEPLSTSLLADQLTHNLLSHTSRFAAELQTHARESAFAWIDTFLERETTWGQSTVGEPGICSTPMGLSQLSHLTEAPAIASPHFGIRRTAFHRNNGP
jgi:hypothetical protein